MKIGVVVHGPNVIDTGCAFKIIELLKNYGSVYARLGGTMGRTAVIDARLENVIDISRKLFPSDSLKIFHEDNVDVIFLINYGKSDVTGQVFGYKVYNNYVEKINDDNIPIIQIERPGEVDGSIIPWNNDLDLIYELSQKLNLNIVKPCEIYENHIKQDNVSVNQRIVHGVSPQENILVNGVVVGKTNSDKLILISKSDKLVDIVGGELKSHGVEKLGKFDLNTAIIKTGLLRHADVVPRVILNEKPHSFKVSFLDHAGEDVYRFRDSSLVVSIGDDTTLITCDILYRFNIPVVGITDGDLDKVVENGFAVKNSIIFEVESGFDDIIGQNIKRELFNNNEFSYDFSDIDDVSNKIMNVIKNINCNYKIKYID